MARDLFGDTSQAYQIQENYEAGKICGTCNQMGSIRCSRMILASVLEEFRNENPAVMMGKVLDRFSICIATDIDGSLNDRSTCNKYNIGTSIPGL